MIIPYDKKYKEDFIRLNSNWIEKLFEIEQIDIDSFNAIDDKIKNGANIFFNIEDDVVIACAMIEPFIGNDIWEISKVAAINLGSKRHASYPLIEKCISYAKEHGAKEIKIITNSKCEAAIHVYEKFGFKKFYDESLLKIFKRGDYFMKKEL